MTSRPHTARFRQGSLVLLGLVLALVVTGIAEAHDMFVKPTRYFAPENSEVRVRLLNGTFVQSENSIARNRLADASVLTPRGRIALDTAEWGVRGDTSVFHIHTRAAGTYVIGVSTKPSEIDLSGDDFNLYLQEDGIPDVLDARKQAGELGKAVRERYHKHVKAFVQVGNTRSNLYATPMGYPAELMPLENPYTLTRGATLRVRTLVDGKPVANQYVLFGGHDEAGVRWEQQHVRSDAEGIARIPLTNAGIHYVKFINMARRTSGGVDYESKWATITFQVR
ncbi:MAG: DUF4198 domain-containing protein [Gemmatimonadota bacterium]|nr:DUF4198 domain-containing protein [Gemmatimonadota bacterium]MDQ8178239.1 DUF4198 domain-containing protein [Gemmatimonadota bacterium]